MLKWIYLIGANLVGTSLARILTGAGLSLVSFAALSPLVLSLLNEAANSFSGMPSDILNIVLLSGFGVALSSIGSGIMTRVAIKAVSMGVKRG